MLERFVHGWRPWLSQTLPRVRSFISRHRYHFIAGILIFAWCLPYFTTGQRVEWGDFTFFSQAYEAIRLSITHYHQFPWFNPWISGGVPLYANPQMGVFSIQTVFVLLLGAPLGLKIAIAVYTALGYSAMYTLLRRYFSVDKLIASALSLIWIFCSFFVSHLPAHFTFVWYMLAPFYIYLALTIRTWKGGLYLGLALAVMALSQIHNPFFHIILIISVILAVRLVAQKQLRRRLLIALAVAAAVFIVLAGHRAFLTVQNVHQFPRTQLSDPVPGALADFLGPVAPLSFMHPLQWLAYPKEPVAPYGYVEVSATIGIFGLVAGLLTMLYTAFLVRRTPTRQQLRQLKRPLLVLGVALVCLVLAYGAFNTFAPYNFLKHMPIFGQMRVSTRWFIFFDLGLLLFIGCMAMRAPARSFVKFAVTVCLILGVAELFALNAGYPSRILGHQPVVPPKPGYTYPFVQTSYFGQTRKLSDGTTMPDDGQMPHAYREYEATLHNQGILYANDSLVELALDPRRSPGHPTCPVEEGCDLVRSGNATVASWSPNKLILKRTKPGTIYLNMNNSSYFLINGTRDYKLKVAEPFTDFAITDPAQTITITARPSVIGFVLHGIAHRL